MAALGERASMAVPDLAPNSVNRRRRLQRPNIGTARSRRLAVCLMVLIIHAGTCACCWGFTDEESFPDDSLRDDFLEAEKGVDAGNSDDSRQPSKHHSKSIAVDNRLLKENEGDMPAETEPNGTLSSYLTRALYWVQGQFSLTYSRPDTGEHISRKNDVEDKPEKKRLSENRLPQLDELPKRLQNKYSRRLQPNRVKKEAPLIDKRYPRLQKDPDSIIDLVQQQEVVAGLVDPAPTPRTVGAPPGDSSSIGKKVKTMSKQGDGYTLEPSEVPTPTPTPTHEPTNADSQNEDEKDERDEVPKPTDQPSSLPTSPPTTSPTKRPRSKQKSKQSMQVNVDSARSIPMPYAGENVFRTKPESKAKLLPVANSKAPKILRKKPTPRPTSKPVPKPVSRPGPRPLATLPTPGYQPILSSVRSQPTLYNQPWNYHYPSFHHYPYYPTSGYGYYYPGKGYDYGKGYGSKKGPKNIFYHYKHPKSGKSPKSSKHGDRKYHWWYPGKGKGKGKGSTPRPSSGTPRPTRPITPGQPTRAPSPPGPQPTPQPFRISRFPTRTPSRPTQIPTSIPTRSPTSDPTPGRVSPPSRAPTNRPTPPITGMPTPANTGMPTPTNLPPTPNIPGDPTAAPAGGGTSLPTVGNLPTITPGGTALPTAGGAPTVTPGGTALPTAGNVPTVSPDTPTAMPILGTNFPTGVGTLNPTPVPGGGTNLPTAQIQIAQEELVGLTSEHSIVVYSVTENEVVTFDCPHDSDTPAVCCIGEGSWKGLSLQGDTCVGDACHYDWCGFGATTVVIGTGCSPEDDSDQDQDDQCQVLCDERCSITQSMSSLTMHGGMPFPLHQPRMGDR